jgi:hypothetical protein
LWQALYWPVREYNGIPGAESLLICLTGFQKQYREDIMVTAASPLSVFTYCLRFTSFFDANY